MFRCVDFHEVFTETLSPAEHRSTPTFRRWIRLRSIFVAFASACDGQKTVDGTQTPPADGKNTVVTVNTASFFFGGGGRPRIPEPKRRSFFGICN